MAAANRPPIAHHHPLASPPLSPRTTTKAAAPHAKNTHYSPHSRRSLPALGPRHFLSTRVRSTGKGCSLGCTVRTNDNFTIFGFVSLPLPTTISRRIRLDCQPFPHAHHRRNHPTLGSEYYYMEMLDSDTDESDNADDLILGECIAAWLPSFWSDKRPQSPSLCAYVRVRVRVRVRVCARTCARVCRCVPRSFSFISLMYAMHGPPVIRPVVRHPRVHERTPDSQQRRTGDVDAL